MIETPRRILVRPLTEPLNPLGADGSAASPALEGRPSLCLPLPAAQVRIDEGPFQEQSS